MSSCYITLSYHIISHVLLFYLFCCFDLHSLLFYSILFYFISNWFDSILFYSILLNLIYCIVQYSISYQWMVCVCLSIRPSVCLSVWISLCFVFSPVSLFFLYSFFTLSLFIFFFSLSLLSFFMNVFLTHTRTRTRAHKYIWIYVPSYDSYILLQKGVSQESYSSDSIISYLI